MAPRPDLIDVEDALARVDGDMALFAELVQMFFEGLPDQLSALNQAIRARDDDQVHVLAHTIKGAAANFSAHGPVGLAFKLESLGRHHRLSVDAGDCAVAEATFEDLVQSLAAAEALLQARIQNAA